MCTCVCERVYVCVDMCVSACTSVYACVCQCMRICACACVCMYACLCVWSVREYVCVVSYNNEFKATYESVVAKESFLDIQNGRRNLLK